MNFAAMNQRSLRAFRVYGLVGLLAGAGFSVSNAVLAAGDLLGKAILAKGTITADRNDARETLKRLSPVFRQDILRSGANARAQFKMTDNALINLQQNSVLRLQEYTLKSADGGGSVVIELISGGLRTITGAVGKKDKRDYQLRTPTATIGIRGTMYEVELVSEGMYVGAWLGSVWIRSYSGKCDLEIGENFKDRFVFVDKGGACRVLTAIPEVFREGHSSDAVTTIAGQINFDIEPLLENPRRSLPFSGLALGQANSAVSKSRADSVSRGNPLIEIDSGGVVSSSNGEVSDFKQNVGGYPVSWGRWNEYVISPELDGLPSPVSDENGLLWATYEAATAEVISGRTGVVRYDNMVDSLAQSSMGAVSNVAVQMDVDFDSGGISNGALSARVPDHTWVGVFDGQVNKGELTLEFNGGSLVNAQTGAFTDVSGSMAGDFVGNNAQGIIGGFSMIDEANNNNQIEGVFLVEQD